MRPPVHGGLSATPFPGKCGRALDFSANLNDFLPRPPLRRWLRGLRWDCYPDPQATLLRQAIAATAGVEPALVWPGNGASELIASLALACLRPGQRAVVVGPTFAEYRRATLVAHGQAHLALPPGGEEHPLWSAQALRQALEALGPQLVWLCNPNNPTGQYLRRRELEPLVRASQALWVLDESYAPFVEQPDDWTDLAREGRVVLLRSLTKWFSLPGVRLGYVVAAPAVVQALRVAQPPWSVNAAAQRLGACLLAWPHRREQVLQALAEARRQLAAALGRLGLPVLPSSANFLLVRVGDGAACTAWLREQGLVVRDATSFGLPAWIRVQVRRRRASRRLVEALRAWLRGC